MVLFEGGYSNSSGHGESIRTLLDLIYPIEYRDGNIARTIVISGDPYWEGVIPKFQHDVSKTAADHLSKSKYDPIILIGHSLGGSTAHSIAGLVKTTSLLLTLDAVSNDGMKYHLSKPKFAKTWVHVDLVSNNFGHAWNTQNNADYSYIADESVGHSNTVNMYKLAESHVKDALDRCQNPGSVELLKDYERHLYYVPGIRIGMEKRRR